MNAPTKRETNPRTRQAWMAAVILLVAVVAFGVGRLTSGGAPAHDNAHAHNGGKETTWTCSMHPQIQSPDPGACPICGMDLIAVGDSSGPALTPDQIRLTPQAKALARIQTQPVHPVAGTRADLELLGRVDIDETRTRTVTSWTTGRIDRLKIGATGATVSQGQTIATIYSPDIYAAHQDLISAKRQLDRLQDQGGLPVALSSAKATHQAARQRLRLLGVSPGQISRMAQANQPWRNVQIRAPLGGTILEKLVTEGQSIDAGGGIYRVADLSSLWVQLDAYEQDLPQIHTGQRVRLTLEALPGQTFTGTVAFIDPVVDPQTRTAKVRVEVPNTDGHLKPGMYAQATVMGTNADDAPLPSLMVPVSAVLFSGRRSLVYVELPGTQDPTYEAREVRLGTRRGDFYPVTAGLEYAERVVTHGAFQLDADLQIKAGRSLMARPDDHTPTAFDGIVQLSSADRATLAPIIEAYLDIQEALASDDLGTARQNTEHLLAKASAAQLNNPDAQQAWTPLQHTLAIHGRYFTRASSIDNARAAFEQLTIGMGRLLETFGNPLDQPIRQAYCSMAFNNRGAEWFQRGSTINNAYFGAEMLQCGEIRDSLAGGAFKPSSPTSKPASMPSTAHASSPSSAPASQPAPPPSSKPTNPQPKARPISQPTSKPTTAPASSPKSAPAPKPTSMPTSAPAPSPASKPSSSPASKPNGGNP